MMPGDVFATAVAVVPPAMTLASLAALAIEAHRR